MLQICQNISQQRALTKYTQQEMADLLGIKRTTYTNWEKTIVPKIEDLKKLAKIFDIRISTLTNTTENNEAQEPQATFQTKLRDKKNEAVKKGIPFYDAEAAASNLAGEMTPIHAPAGTIDIGDLLHDSQSAIRIYGNSMLPNYPPGCVVGLVEITDNFIQPGEVYVIQTGDQRILKRIFYKDDDPESDVFMCYSDNTMKFEGGARNGKGAYPPFYLSRKEIRKLFIVTGVIKRNTNSIIMNRNN